MQRRIITELNSYLSLIRAEIDVWRRSRELVKEKYPDVRYTYNLQMREWANHPLQRYIKLVEMKIPLPDPTEIMSLNEWREYLIWNSENHKGVKEWQKYGRRLYKIDKKEKDKKESRAYIPKVKR